MTEERDRAAASVVVRPLREHDAAAWRRLFAEYGAFYGSDFSDEVLDRVWAIVVDPAGAVNAFVGEFDGEVVGFAHYRSHPDTFSGELDWFLDDLYTAEAARGHGVATALIERLTAKARATAPHGSLRWITAADNARAQRVYDTVATRTTWVTYEVRL
ncbi:GNAT family N-acetyltransferase [Galbitalea sp. SE-J8]|uniref:GNAT family N-acetyltransferase n=1 Tax=Galbitalea sp. SE-J8 TaxID=3054952 RepID=UPI00259C84BB|nr:GNAT family N-acetyltransferase [Galbitalea sp. SE-J8]MDM4761683.1 GNAT family N-acetyltransferase [Galbitalea sp. SE-J8]